MADIYILANNNNKIEISCTFPLFEDNEHYRQGTMSVYTFTL